MKPKQLRVACAQMKFRPGLRDNVDRIVAFIGEAAAAGCDAVLFPECAVTGYRPELGELDPQAVREACRQIAGAARRSRCNVLLGSPTHEEGRWFNSLLLFNRQGREVFRYDKIHLTKADQRFFSRGNKLALFKIDGVPATAIICHERRFPELVRLPVMMGAQVLFHANAGLDSLAVSKSKRGGRDGIVARAFENQIHYAFANTVGPQTKGLWSAGDSKIVAPDSSVLALADNRTEGLIEAVLDLGQAGRTYAREALLEPAFLREGWKHMLALCQAQLRRKPRRAKS